MGRRRGNRLLLAHCARLESLIAARRPTARERLDAALGEELARALIVALAGDHARPLSHHLL
jgi:hypothetical protein